jgi:multiple sugar transport system substrate-binding protein
MRRRPAVVAAKPSGTVTFGSNEAGGVTIRRSAVMRWWRPTRRNQAQVKINAVDHNTFQENINNYLQGNADDVFSWFAGYRMQFCRRAGLIVTSATCGENLSGFNDAFKKPRPVRTASSTSCRTLTTRGGLLPQVVWEERGYQPSDDIRRVHRAGATRCKRTGSTAWPSVTRTAGRPWAPSTIITWRINGYDVHINLMAGKEAWTPPE